MSRILCALDAADVVRERASTIAMYCKQKNWIRFMKQLFLILYTIFERIRLAAFGGRTTIITMYVIEQYVTGTKYFLGKFSKMFYWLEQVQSKAIRRPLLTCSSVSPPHEGKSVSSWGEICLSTLSGEIHLMREIQQFWPTEQKPSWSGLSRGGRKRVNNKHYLSSTNSFF